jgi:hypothetical protein
MKVGPAHADADFPDVDAETYTRAHRGLIR